MKVAVLGWGSLIWNPENLLIEGEWKTDGPLLPIEFARISSDRRLTLVIKPNYKRVRTLYALSAFSTLDEARNNLHVREGTTETAKIGFIDFITGESQIKRIAEEIKAELYSWNKTKDFDAVIWTDLGPNFNNKSGLEFNIHNIKRYLAGLSSEEFAGAKNYIVNAPAQVTTQLRKDITSYIELRDQSDSSLVSSQSFFHIPRGELLNYYPEIVANSSKQFKAAEDLASLEHYGMGLSHLLISTEEMIKALIVVLDARGFKFRDVKGMDIFFRNHEIRFFIGYIAFIFTLFGEDIIKHIGQLRDDPSKVKELIALQKNKEAFDLALKWYFLRKLIVIKRELNWFSQAEVFRQNGFYVDMKGVLILPARIKSSEFIEAKKRIEKVNRTIQYIIDSFLTEDAGIKKEIESIKAKFQKEDYYKKIEEELENRRKGRVPFFEKFKLFLEGLSDSIRDSK